MTLRASSYRGISADGVFDVWADRFFSRLGIPTIGLFLSGVLAVGLLVFSGCSMVAEEKEYDVVPYEGSEITATSVHEAWFVQIDGADVILRNFHRAHPDDSIGFVVELHDNPNALPTLVDVWYGPHDGGIGRAIREATVEIQSWDLETEISGLLRAEYPSGQKTASPFWIDLSELRSE